MTAFESALVQAKEAQRNDNLEGMLEKLRAACETDPEQFELQLRQLIALQGRLQSWKGEVIEGTLSFEEKNLERNRLRRDSASVLRALRKASISKDENKALLRKEVNVLTITRGVVQQRPFRKHWVVITLAAGILCHPRILPLFLQVEFPSWYFVSYYGAFCLFLLSSFYYFFLQAQKANKSTKTDTWNETSPIKGLLAFEQRDEELFQKLQRSEDVQRCLQMLQANRFSIGVLKGVSGCGKTSFLQAGLLPALLRSELPCVYVKFSDQSPNISITAAIEEQIGLSISQDLSFDQILREVVAKTQLPSLVLLFDQFEQFYTHHPTTDQQAPFIEQLKVTKEEQDLNGIKLFFSIRSDFVQHLFDLQNQLGLSLTAFSNYYQLDNFTPEQATRIFEVMARSEGIDFKETFVKEICEKELASPQDGRISAVDIQILALMLKGQQASDQRAFTRQAYERFGGFEGLLERYLRQHLDSPSRYNQDQAALKVLLALTDLDFNVRAGLLSLDQLQERLKGQGLTQALPDILQWLAKIRLIRIEVQEEGSQRFELAHERIILPLRAVANKTLSSHDQLSQLLNRRVNEWLGNDRAKKYLLTIGEYVKVRRNRGLISWEPKRAAKEELMLASGERVKRHAGGFGLGLVICLLVVGIWNTPWMIHKRVRYWDLPGILDNSTSETLSEIAMHLVHGDTTLAREVAESIKDPIRKDNAFIFMLSFPPEDPDFKESNIWDKILWEATIAHKIQDLPKRYAPFFDLAQKATDSGYHDLAIVYLHEASKSLGTFRNNFYRSDKYCEFAATSFAAGDHQLGLSFLQLGAEIQNTDEFVTDKAKLFQVLAKTAIHFGHEEKGLGYLQSCIGYSNSVPLRYFQRAEEFPDSLIKTMVTLGSKGNNLPFLLQVTELADVIKIEAIKATIFWGLARELAKNNHTNLAVEYFQKGKLTAQKIETYSQDPDNSDEVFVSSGVGIPKIESYLAAFEATIHIGEEDLINEYLTQCEELIQNLNDSDIRVKFLQQLAQISEKTGLVQKTEFYLREAIEILGYVGYGGGLGRVNDYLEVAKLARELGRSQLGEELLQLGFDKLLDNYLPPPDRIIQLKKLALAASEFGLEKSCLEYFDHAINISNAGIDSFDKYTEQLGIAEDIAQAGSNMQNPILLDSLGRIATQLVDTSAKVTALIRVSHFLLKKGRIQEAIFYIQQAGKGAKVIKYPGQRASLILGIAKEIQVIGQEKKAKTILLEGLEVVNTIDSEDSKAALKREYLQFAAKMGEWQLAFSVAKNIIDPRQKALAYATWLNEWVRQSAVD